MRRDVRGVWAERERESDGTPEQGKRKRGWRP
jgi:hypothetical protein